MTTHFKEWHFSAFSTTGPIKINCRIGNDPVKCVCHKDDPFVLKSGEWVDLSWPNPMTISPRTECVAHGHTFEIEMRVGTPVFKEAEK